MTIEEFLKELKELKLKWLVSENGFIRCENGDCPIIALVKARGLSDPDFPGTWDNSMLKIARKLLGLEQIDSGRLAGAADNRSHPFRETVEKALFESSGGE